MQSVIVDCKLSCTAFILTAILNGTLNPVTALQGGHLVADNVQMLTVFGKSFQLDKELFDKYKRDKSTSIAEAPTASQTSAQVLDDNFAIGMLLKKFLIDVLGEQNKVVRLLKTINSATVSPAIVELKFCLGVNYLTKDVSANTWKFDIYLRKQENLIEVKSRKWEQELKLNLFHYEWELNIKFDWKMDFQGANLQVTNLVFPNSSVASSAAGASSSSVATETSQEMNKKVS